MSWLSGLRSREPQPSPAKKPPPNPPSEDEDENEDENELGAGEGEEVNMAPTVNYDAHHADDEGENAMEKAITSLKNHPWMEEDLKFYFSRVEVKMKAAGVKSNFTKLQVLSTIIPTKVVTELKSLLSKQESEFTNKDGYLQAKTKILQIFGPPEGASVERALGRVLSGKPSQLWNALTEDLCDKELKNCCCLKIVAALWRKAIPTSVRQAVAHYDLSLKTVNDILQVADDVFESNKTPAASASVAAIAANVAAMSLATPEKGASEGNHQETPEVLNQAFHPFMPSTLSADQTAQIAQAAQIAAIYQTYTRGRGSGRGGRGQRGGRGGRGGANGGQQHYSANNPRWKTPRHPDSPPFGACKRHWQFGKSSFVCLEPQTCPWKQHIQPRTQN